MTNEKRKETIAALLREREGYERYGKKDRVKEVDAQLAALGHGARPPAKRAETMTTKPAEAEFRRGPGRPRKSAG